MSQDQGKGKGKKERTPPPAFTPGTEGLFQVRKPVVLPEPQPESEPTMQSDSAVEEKQEGAQENQQNEAPDNRSPFTTTSQANVREVPHSSSIPSQNLAGQNVVYPASIPLKKSATVPVPQRSIAPVEQQKSQIVERRTVEVTIRIYEDQRREIEDILRHRVNALIDSGVEVDRRKYQVSVIYTELLDFALSLVKQQKQNK